VYTLSSYILFLVLGTHMVVDEEDCFDYCFGQHFDDPSEYDKCMEECRERRYNTFEISDIDDDDDWSDEWWEEDIDAEEDEW